MPWLLVGLLGVLVVYPLVHLLQQPLGRLGELWDQALQIAYLDRMLWRTVWLGAGSMALATIAALILALCRANLAGRAGAIAQVVAVVPLVVPPLAGVTGWAFLLSPQVGYLNVALRELPFLDHLTTGPFDGYTMPWIIIITGIYLIPYAFIFIQAGLSNIDPRLEDAARSAGSSWWGVQVRIVLPLLRPALVYGGGVVALLALGQFTAPLLLGRSQGIDVITTQLYRLTGAPPPDYPLATFIALPILLLALAGVAAQRRALRSSTRFVMTSKGTGRARGHNPWLIIPVIVYSFLLVVPPIISLVLVAITPYWGAPLTPDNISLNAFYSIFDNPTVVQAIKNSLRFSIIAMLIALALSTASALVAVRSRGLPRTIVDYIINIPIAVPAILFGMAIFVTLALGPIMQFSRQWLGIRLYGSATVIIAAYIILIIPHGTRLVMSGLAQVNRQLEDAARVSGSTAGGALVRVLLPLLRRHLVSAAMLMFILCSHEFAASSLLVGPFTQVMSTVLYGQWDTGTYSHVAALALVMCAIAIAGLSVIVAFDRDGSRTTGRRRRRQQTDGTTP